MLVLAAWANWSIGIFATAKMAHLSDDEAVAKMGHPVFVAELDLSHPPRREIFRQSQV